MNAHDEILNKMSDQEKIDHFKHAHEKQCRLNSILMDADLEKSKRLIVMDVKISRLETNNKYLRSKLDELMEATSENALNEAWEADK